MAHTTKAFTTWNSPQQAQAKPQGAKGQLPGGLNPRHRRGLHGTGLGSSKATARQPPPPLHRGASAGTAPKPHAAFAVEIEVLGLPMGVSMLPRLAAKVCITTRGTTCRPCPAIRSTNSPKGTKVSSATSLVTTILSPKGEEHQHPLAGHGAATRRSNPLARHRETPPPAGTPSSPPSGEEQRQGVPIDVSKYAALGGTKQAETTASSSAMLSTASRLAKAMDRAAHCSTMVSHPFHKNAAGFRQHPPV